MCLLYLLLLFVWCYAGESGLGKSTLVNSLFLTDLYKDRKLLNAEGENAATTTTAVNSHFHGNHDWQLLLPHHHDNRLIKLCLLCQHDNSYSPRLSFSIPLHVKKKRAFEDLFEVFEAQLALVSGKQTPVIQQTTMGLKRMMVKYAGLAKVLYVHGAYMLCMWNICKII